MSGWRSRGGRARAVHTADGERVAADAVVLNPDLPVAYRDLLGRRPPRRSAGCATRRRACCCSPARPRRTRRSRTTTIHFGQAWRRTFDEIIRRRPADARPVAAGDATRPGPTRRWRRPGGTAYYVLVPTPNLDAGIDWAATGPRYRDELVADAGGARVRRVRRRRSRSSSWSRRPDWAASRAGAPARRSRPRTRSPRPGRSGRRRWPAGWTTSSSPAPAPSPGVGVPMVLLSGRLAAERITGRDRGDSGRLAGQAAGRRGQAGPIRRSTMRADRMTSGRPPPGWVDPPTRNSPRTGERFGGRRKAERAPFDEVP